jgi:hypothetical protein
MTGLLIGWNQSDDKTSLIIGWGPYGDETGLLIGPVETDILVLGGLLAK